MKPLRTATAKLGLGLLAITAVGLSGCGLFGPPEVVNQTHQGTLETGDTINQTDQSLQDDYTIRVQQGWVITGTLSAPTFDPYIWIMPGDQTSAQQLASQPGTHVVTLSYTAPTTGEYIVRANSITAGQTGAYTLQITAGPPGAAAPAAPAAPPPPPAP